MNELVTDEWFELIQKHSGLSNLKFDFDTDKLNIAVEVQKCLCNLVFNSPVAAGLCCKNGILEQLTDRLKLYENKQMPEEITYFDVKLLFLLTALCSEVRIKVKEDMGGADSLIKILDVILKKAAEGALPNKIILDVSNSNNRKFQI